MLSDTPEQNHFSHFTFAQPLSIFVLFVNSITVSLYITPLNKYRLEMRYQIRKCIVIHLYKEQLHKGTRLSIAGPQSKTEK